jgi:hypothetical protein
MAMGVLVASVNSLLCGGLCTAAPPRVHHCPPHWQAKRGMVLEPVAAIKAKRSAFVMCAMSSLVNEALAEFHTIMCPVNASASAVPRLLQITELAQGELSTLNRLGERSV